MENLPIRVLLADDQPPCIKAISFVLEQSAQFQICGIANNGSELIIKAGKLKPDVIITDIRMPILDGIAAIEAIKAMHPFIKILAMTQFAADQLLLQVIKAGADGLILKGTSVIIIKKAIEVVLSDTPFFCGETIKGLVTLLRQGRPTNNAQQIKEDFFAPNEKEILDLICQGKTSKEIALALRLSYFTVIKYRQKLMDKSQTQNVAELILFAIRYGLYDPNA
jgi:DNA-binding NarL/FixJ family response regulator